MERFTTRQITIVGTILVLIPVVVLAVFTIGEVGGGDPSGLQHLAGLLPLVLLAGLAWRLPRWAGSILIGAGVLLLGVFLIFFDWLSLTVLLTMVALLFAPAIAAGLLFLQAGSRPTNGHGGGSNAPDSRVPMAGRG